MASETHAGTPLWRIELLGGLRVIQSDRVITRFGHQKAAALLAALALAHTGEPRRLGGHLREELVELLWPEIDPELGRGKLRFMLHSLRQQLEPSVPSAASPLAPETFPARGTPPRLLIADRSTLRLDPSNFMTDVAEFRAALHAASRSAAPGERAQLLTGAATLYQGELLPGFFDPWVLTERQHLAELYLEALHQLAAALEQAGDLESALAYAQRAVSIDPLREEAHYLLMRLYAAAGQPSATLHQYQELERRLREELGETPSAASRALAEELRQSARSVLVARSGPRAEPPPDAGTPVFPPAPPVSAPRLPVQLTSFFGREPELARLRKLLQPGAAPPASDGSPASERRRARLITLTAPGGSGKTRLAVEAAQAVAPAFGGRVWFVDLAGLPDPNLLPYALASALQLPQTAGTDPLEPVVDALSAAPALLLLDNFEHLLRDPGAGGKDDHPAGSGGGAAIVRLLLERAPRLTCLVTSRQPLHLGGEQEFPLPPLALPVGSEAPEQLMEVGSVALYVDRAQAALPDFALTAQNAKVVAALCRKLEGMPLAIEMAAAWAKTLPPARMLERLEHQLSLLVSRRRDLPPRQQSLRATIQWSYDLLSTELQAWFARLGVFRGGWTLAAAEAICSGVEGDALLLLSELQERSLIVAEVCGAAVPAGEDSEAPAAAGLGMDEDTETRYRMLEPLREFALEKLTLEERDALDRRHARYFTALAEQAKVSGSEQHEERELAWLERDHENLRVALEWSLSAAGDLSLGLALGAALGWFWQSHNYFQEGRQYLTRLLDHTRQEKPHSMHSAPFVQAATYAARFTRFQGDSRSARLLLDESLRLARALGDAALIATPLCELALFFQRDPQVRRAMCEESLALFRAVGDQQSAGQVLVSLGTGCYRDDLPRARALCEEGLAVFRQLGAKTRIAWCLVHLGDLAYQQGDYIAARSHADESLTLFRVVGDRLGMSCSLTRLGRLALVAGRCEEARSCQEQALEIARELGAPRDMACILTYLGDIAREEGDRARAAAQYEQVLEICHFLADRGQALGAMLGLAQMAEQERCPERAAAWFTEILTLGQEVEAPDLILIGLEWLARQAALSGRPEQAARLLGAAAALRQRLGAAAPPNERPEDEPDGAAVRAALGEARFQEAWTAGQALTLEQAAAEALGGIENGT